MSDKQVDTDHYPLIAKAIGFLTAERFSQPSLDQLANHLQLSPTQTQKLFSRWAGISPKRFMQFLTLAEARQRLSASSAASSSSDSLFETSLNLGLSGGSRLYDHFVTLEAVTPGEFRSNGEGIGFQIGQAESPYGRIWAAMTRRGIHQLRFINTEPEAGTLEQELRAQWPQAQFRQNDQAARSLIEQLFVHPTRKKPLSLWVKGTNFQIQVWQALLAIQPGQLSSYGTLAQTMEKPGAARAIGSAIGANPVALIIPCHRVIQQSGALSGYRWGTERKQAILCHEWAQAEQAWENQNED
ncbi:MAG: methylated-DNA--[protein]-cysteine S-methyltransferase [Oceanobacter sp.]